jgi:hypothetical protein
MPSWSVEEGGVSLLIAMLIGFGIAFTIALSQTSGPNLLETRHKALYSYLY